MHGKQLHLFRYVISYQQAKYNYEPKFRNDAYLVRDNNGDIIKGKEFISPKHINTEDEKAWEMRKKAFNNEVLS